MSQTVPSTQEPRSDEPTDQAVLSRHHSTLSLSSTFTSYPCNQQQYLDMQRERKRRRGISPTPSPRPPTRQPTRSPSPLYRYSYPESPAKDTSSAVVEFADASSFTNDERAELEALMNEPTDRALMRLFREHTFLKRDHKSLEGCIADLVTRVASLEGKQVA